MLPKSLTFIDVETTGMSPGYDRIIDIGIVRVENGKIRKVYESLVNPERYIPSEITLLTGIYPQQLEDAPVFESIKDEIQGLLTDSVFVAHNAKFDYSFIKAEFARTGVSFTAKTLCTAKLSRALFPRHRRHSLDSIIERFDIACDVRHRALPDAKVMWEFYRRIQKLFPKKHIEEAIDNVTKNTALPPAVTPSHMNALPESPGVYIFYDSSGAPLYVGKSINIKERVQSHFYEFSRSTKEAHIYQSIASIEIHKTAGELGALLMESHLIKTMQPLLNKLLRKKNSLIALLKTTLPFGYFTIDMRDIESISPEERNTILAVYRSKAQLKEHLRELSSEFQLCQKLLGIEHSKGKCFGSQIHTCFGACANEELPIKYNMRFAAAFAKTKLKQWPFPGPIVISEGNDRHIVHNWCYVGANEEDLESTHEPMFDYDTYKILARFLLKRTRDSAIRVVQLPGVLSAKTEDANSRYFS